MYAVVRGPIVATINGHYISYHVELWHGGTLLVLFIMSRVTEAQLSVGHGRARVAHETEASQA